MYKMLRSIFLLLALVIIVLGLGRLIKGSNKTDEVFVADIEEDKPDIEEKNIKYTTDNLNLRTGPSIDEESLLVIPKGEPVKVIDSDGQWDKLIYNNIVGYSSNEYLSDTRLEEIIDHTNGQEDDELEIIVSAETMKIVNGVLLVNKEYALAMDYDPGEDPEAREYLDEMLEACYDEIGKPLTAFSGYRTYEYQKGLFDRYVEKDGYENAMMYSAKPRHSEHETGLAFDIGGADQSYWLEETFEDTEEGIWLRENAHRFGFILRYPKGKTDITGYIYEPWHFRYVGREDAIKIYELDITLEEYLLD